MVHHNILYSLIREIVCQYSCFINEERIKVWGNIHSVFLNIAFQTNKAIIHPSRTFDVYNTMIFVTHRSGDWKVMEYGITPKLWNDIWKRCSVTVISLVLFSISKWITSITMCLQCFFMMKYVKVLASPDIVYHSTMTRNIYITILYRRSQPHFLSKTNR